MRPHSGGQIPRACHSKLPNLFIFGLFLLGLVGIEQAAAQTNQGQVTKYLQYIGQPNNTCGTLVCEPGTSFSNATYKCSTDPNWSDGKINFNDPLPASTFITSVNLTFVGRYFCDPSSSQETVYTARINEDVVTVSQFPNTFSGCDNDCCVSQTEVSSSSFNDFSHYNYGEQNTFELDLIVNSVCLQGVSITFFYGEVEIQSMSPSSGPAIGNTEIIVTGGIFQNNSGNTELFCEFGTAAVVATIINETDLTCNSPVAPSPTGNTVVSFAVGYYVGNKLVHFFNTSQLLFTFVGSPAPGPDPAPFDFISYLESHWYFVLITLLVLLIGGVTLVLTCRSKKRKSSLLPELSPLLGNSSTDKIKIQGEINFEEIQFLEKIGRGNFGEVYKAQWRGTIVAVKKTKVPKTHTEEEREEFMKDFQKEAGIISQLRHPNIVQFLGLTVLEDDEICIITEYMPRGSLYKLIHDKHDKFAGNLRLKIALDVAKGMNYLHKSDPVIVHRDLKSHNLLVDEHFKVKVCDFGLATLLNASTSKNALTSCGTPAWTAPEVLRNEKYTEKCDIFSFGVVLWELVTREEPWKELDAFQIVWTVGSSKARLAIPSSCPPDIEVLIKDCMAEEPATRPSFEQITKMLTDVEWK